MTVVYISHPRYGGMTVINFITSPLTREEVSATLPHPAFHGPSSCVWIIPGTWKD